MPYYVYRHRNRVGVIQADQIMTDYPFETATDAESYQRQLQDHYATGRTGAHQRRSTIKCMTTGAVYPSMSAAAQAVGVSPSAISRHINQPALYPHVRGLTFARHPASQ